MRALSRVIAALVAVAWTIACAIPEPGNPAGDALVKGKTFRIPGDQIRDLAPHRGSCLASDNITVRGESVGYMYREEPDNDIDSGWRFFAGAEDQEFADDPSNFALYDVNTIANYDPSIIPLLDAPSGSAFERDEDGHLIPIPLPADPDED